MTLATPTQLISICNLNSYKCISKIVTLNLILPFEKVSKQLSIIFEAL